MHKITGLSNTLKLSTNESRASLDLDQGEWRTLFLEIADHLSDASREVEGPGLDDLDLLARLVEPVDEGVRRRPGGAQDEPDDWRTEEYHSI